MFELPRAMCEDVGIPSTAVLNFMKRLEQYQIPMHSILLARHGKLVTEAYYAPYEADTLHRMFSISKSFTSIAIGLLAEEGQISLDDPIIKYFPDKLPEENHPWIAKMTIRDMLKMETCHTSTTYKLNMELDWVESFFVTEPTHEPGTVFSYDTSSSHTLSALVERLTGKPMLDYMREKFLDELSFSKEAYIVKDPFGVSMGGSGLMATPMDIMKFAMVVMNQGKHKGKQLLPEWYIKEATMHQTDTLMNGAILEESQGYGYMFWRTQQGGFACYGMGGQYAICLPEQDLICVTTADTQGIQGANQLIFNSLYEELLPSLYDKPLPANALAQDKLNACISQLAIKPLHGSCASPLAESLNGRTYSLETKPSGFDSLALEFAQEEGKLIFTDERGSHEIGFGLGKMVASKFPIYSLRCLSSGIWQNEDSLYIKSHIIDECVGSVHFKLVFRGDALTLYMKKIEETYFKEFAGFVSGNLEK